MEVIPLKEWYNKSLAELKLRNKYGVNIIAIKENDDINISPGPDFVIKEGIILITIGGTDAMKNIEKNSKEK